MFQNISSIENKFKYFKTFMWRMAYESCKHFHTPWLHQRHPISLQFITITPYGYPVYRQTCFMYVWYACSFLNCGRITTTDMTWRTLLRSLLNIIWLSGCIRVTNQQNHTKAVLRRIFPFVRKRAAEHILIKDVIFFCPCSLRWW